MIEFQIEPWETWPRKETPDRSRKWSPFKADYSTTLQRLDYELRHLKAGLVVVQVKAKRADIRLDGQLRPEAQLSHPGVIVAFKRDGRHPMSMACDACRQWKHNLHAIALTLERLRLADLYGVTQSGEQYRGWEALPPPGAQPIRAMTREGAADIIQKWSGVSVESILESAILRTAAIKVARVKTHPDKGGTAADAAEVAVAAELLEREAP